jgi:glycerol-3-phosphate dehydrogenase (NAD(P)+)
MRQVAVIGGGAWGTTLAVHLATRGPGVRLWMLENDLVDRMLERRDNPVYLPGVEIPEAVTPTGRLEEALAGAELILGVVPSHHARAVYGSMAAEVRAGTPVILATKGIEESGLALPVDVARETLGAAERPYAVLSGPSFAAEVARGLPTALVVASEDPELGRQLQELLSSNSLRVYTNPDVVGVQLAGALKNVIAIAAGILDGLGMGHNTLAALLTRGLAEITRLGLALGGSPSTFSGLAGVGDLVLTCTGGLSRNRRVGQALGRGELLREIVAHSSSVAEGIRTTRAARELAHRAGVEMPIVEEMYRILYEDRSPDEAWARLMSRPLTSEDRGRS